KNKSTSTNAAAAKLSSASANDSSNPKNKRERSKSSNKENAKILFITEYAALLKTRITKITIPLTNNIKSTTASNQSLSFKITNQHQQTLPLPNFPQHQQTIHQTLKTKEKGPNRPTKKTQKSFS